MNKSNYDLVVIGGGPAGMRAALAAYNHGVKDILVLERDKELGGILNQCIHNGFGFHYFQEELTGPEYSARVFTQLKHTTIDYRCDSMVLHIDNNENEQEKIVHTISPQYGYNKITTKAIILAMGCRERTRGAINLFGSRPAGIYTAGTAQRLINIDGYMPGKTVVILGSGDIGLIVARRMTLEGAKVIAVIESSPYPHGLKNNIIQCLDDYQIPLLLNHMVVRIHGQNRITGVTIAKVDNSQKDFRGKAILDTERFIPCDTLLLSVGLIPENEISRKIGIDLDKRTNGPIVAEYRQTSIPGIFACGNVVHVHDLVDCVTEEADIAGNGAAKYIQNNLANNITHTITTTEDINYVVPQHINIANIDANFKIYLRVKTVLENKIINVYLGNKIIAQKKAAKFLPAEMVSFSLNKQDLLMNCSQTAFQGTAQTHDSSTKNISTHHEIIIKIEEI